MARINRDGFTYLSGSRSASSDGATLKYEPAPRLLNAHALTPHSVIFVHGLRGHPRDTWTGPIDTNADKTTDTEAEPGADTSPAGRKRERLKSLFKPRRAKAKPAEIEAPRPLASPDVFWPEQYLVPDIPDARVWTYGYNADVIGGLFQSNNKNSVSQHGRDLAVRLEREIDNEVFLRIGFPQRSAANSCIGSGRVRRAQPRRYHRERRMA